jgi:hypothetical protein
VGSWGWGHHPASSGPQWDSTDTRSGRGSCPGSGKRAWIVKCQSTLSRECWERPCRPARRSTRRRLSGRRPTPQVGRYRFGMVKMHTCGSPKPEYTARSLLCVGIRQDAGAGADYGVDLPIAASSLQARGEESCAVLKDDPTGPQRSFSPGGQSTGSTEPSWCRRRTEAGSEPARPPRSSKTPEYDPCEIVGRRARQARIRRT